ncbi:hypothetical protein I312_104706 [Cryptococcus bacillisporus CA1280]|uniref:uncharacterized protein n=1 Tax=Cryptococcus bacillisporus CA1280 TaxID=1296109 RepID=UPI0033680B5F
MYWPTVTTRLVGTPYPLDKEPITHARSSRKGNFFAIVTKDGLGVWDVRPTVMQAAVLRSKASIDRFGSNVDVFWAHDGRGLIILTDTSHLLFYQLLPSSRPSYDSPGPSTPGPGEGDVVMGWELRALGTAFVMGGCGSVLPQTHNIIMALRHPPSILSVPYPVPSQLLTPPNSHFPPPPLDAATESQVECETWDLGNSRSWIIGKEPPVPTKMTAHKTPALPMLHIMLTKDGRAYAVYQASQLIHFSNNEVQRSQLSAGPKYIGIIIHPPLVNLPKKMEMLDIENVKTSGDDVEDKAVEICINFRFSLVAIGSGKINIISLPSWPSAPKLSHTLDLRHSGNLKSSPGQVKSLAWTGDGYCLAAGYERGWAAWSMGGRLNGWGVQDEDESEDPGVVDLMDDRVMVYRGADQPDMSVINPESDVWQSIKIPTAYIATNWPIRYASISSDGKLIAVAGRRGLTHYSATSGRWRLFQDEREERDFTVKGGLLWFHHVLIVAVDADKTHQIRLYSRDLDLNEILHSQTLPSPVLVMTLLENSLQSSIKLHLCGSISFRGIIEVPTRVRALSWLIPEAQKTLGDPADDLIVATIIFLVDGKLVLLRPRRARTDEVRYDMQILADRIEVYWTHLQGVGTLENSLWGFDGLNMRIWLDALTIEATKVDLMSDAYENVEESVKLRPDFYPLSILMDKGIIIGVDYETSTRTLPFPIHKTYTGTHLFLPQFLRYHLSSSPPSLANALILAQHYQSLVYFAHSLEVLLHSVLEDEDLSKSESNNDDRDSKQDSVLAAVVIFLDYFPESLDVIVRCARKTEIERWPMLFDLVGKPRHLFENCLKDGKIRTAASYLLVLHTLEGLEDADDTIRLLHQAIRAQEFNLCKELLRFLHSIDDSGDALRKAIAKVGIIEPADIASGSETPTKLSQLPMPTRTMQ